MLQQWRKPTLIAITPDGITINSGSKPPQVIDTKKASSWQQVLIELENSAASIAANSVRFIISNQYVRYAVLPWQSGVFSQQDWQSLAENHMRTLHGNIVGDWTIRASMQGHGKPLVVSAIDQSLLSRLEELATQNNWVVDSVEPALMSITNHYQNKINKNDWLIISEPQYLLLVEKIKGVLVNFSVLMPPVSEASSQALKLVNRTLKLQENTSLKQLHVFGDLSLPSENDKLNINNLSKNKDNDNTLGIILAGLI